MVRVPGIDPASFRRVNSAAPLKLADPTLPDTKRHGIPPSELGGSIEADLVPLLGRISSLAFRRVNSAAPLKLVPEHVASGEAFIPPSELGGSIEATHADAF